MENSDSELLHEIRQLRALHTRCSVLATVFIVGVVLPVLLFHSWCLWVAFYGVPNELNRMIKQEFKL
jgi:hypothetical protein